MYTWYCLVLFWSPLTSSGLLAGPLALAWQRSLPGAS